MKVSEKSLELNVGAELLTQLRGTRNMPKAYLRGLTQREESRTGVDFFAQLPHNTRIFAFQFKAPKGRSDRLPYRFTLSRCQHMLLHALAQQAPRAVHYVFPFYVSTPKLEHYVPNLAQDTWLLPAAPLNVTAVFSRQMTKTVQCFPGLALVNPEYEMSNLAEVELSSEDGIQPDLFAEWYRELRQHDLEQPPRLRRMNPHIVRGLRVVIVGQNDSRRGS